MGFTHLPIGDIVEMADYLRFQSTVSTITTQCSQVYFGQLTQYQHFDKVDDLTSIGAVGAAVGDYYHFVVRYAAIE